MRNRAYFAEEKTVHFFLRTLAYFFKAQELFLHSNTIMAPYFLFQTPVCKNKVLENSLGVCVHVKGESVFCILNINQISCFFCGQMAVSLALLILVFYINKYLLQNAALKTWFIQRLYSFCVTSVKWRGCEHHSILAWLLWKVNFFLFFFPSPCITEVIGQDFQYYIQSRCFVKG